MKISLKNEATNRIVEQFVDGRYPHPQALLMFIQILFYFLLPNSTFAFESQLRSSLALTTNANLEDSAQDSDWIANLRYLGRWNSEKHRFSILLSYYDYFSQSQNDVFFWRAQHVMPTSLKIQQILDWTVAISGQSFTRQVPANSEENFDYIDLESSLSHEMELKPSFTLLNELVYDIKRFSNFSGRTDHRLSFNNSLECELNSSQSLIPGLDLSFVKSSDDLYSRFVLTFGLDWRKELSPRWTLGSRLAFRNTTYPNRTVASQTIVAVGRGKFRTTSENQNERHSLVQWELEAINYRNKFNWGSRMSLNRQTSRSGFEDYSEAQIMTFIEGNF